MSRLFLEATLRRTPLPQSERGLALPDRFLLDPLTYQQRPAELALKGCGRGCCSRTWWDWARRWRSG